VTYPNAGSACGRVAVQGVIMRGCPLAPLAGGALTQGLRQFAARPSWRPAASIFTGQGLRDASGQRPCLTWDVTAQGPIYGTVRFSIVLCAD
jgi:hypothetical protein